jgi:hypothetical protein
MIAINLAWSHSLDYLVLCQQSREHMTGYQVKLTTIGTTESVHADGASTSTSRKATQAKLQLAVVHKRAMVFGT